MIEKFRRVYALARELRSEMFTLLSGTEYYFHNFAELDKKLETVQEWAISNVESDPKGDQHERD